jgi:hypothetical protein
MWVPVLILVAHITVSQHHVGDAEFAKSNSRGGSGLTTGPSHRYRKSERLVALSARAISSALVGERYWAGGAMFG